MRYNIGTKKAKKQKINKVKKYKNKTLDLQGF
jgi:hypothetical protein